VTIGELLVEINGDNSGLKKSLGESTNSLSTAVGKMVSGVALAAAAWKGVDLAIQGINYNKAAEQAEIAFGSFLGSAEAAKNMIEDLRDLAKETPLEFAEVRDAAKQMSAFGIEAGKIIPTMRMLSDVSAGLGIPIKDLAYLFGTIKTQGKAMTVDLMQFANRGIPIWDELAKVTGKSSTELRKMVEAGQIGFPQINKAFQNMTSEGGKFFNMAVKQMDSLAGAQSNLNDSFDVWLGHMTEALTGPLKDTSNWLSNFLSGMVAIDKEYSNFVNTTNDWAATLFGTKANSEAIFKYWKGLAGTISNDDTAQRKFANTAEKISLEYPEAFKRNNKDIGKTIADLSTRYGFTVDVIKEILLQTRAVDDKTKGLVKSGLDLNAKAVDYADRIKYANSLQGEAVSKAAQLKAEVAATAVKEKEFWDSIKKIPDFTGAIAAQTEKIGVALTFNLMKMDDQIDASLAISEQKQLEEDLTKKIAAAMKLAADETFNASMAASAWWEELDDVSEDAKKIAKSMADMGKELGFASDQFASLAKSASKFENEALSKILSDMAMIANDAKSFADGLGDLAKSGGKDAGAWIQVIVSGVALVADAWNVFWGGQSEAQKRADEAARKAEEERVAAVRKLESEYQAKTDSDLKRLEKERDDRVAYARSIGADVLNIERYYAGEIAKIRTRSSGTAVEESAIAAETAAITAKYEKLRKAEEIAIRSNESALKKRLQETEKKFSDATQATQDAAFKAWQDAKKALADAIAANNTALTAALAPLDEAMRSELDKIETSLAMYQDRFSQAFEGISSALIDALKSGASQADFRETIMDMLKNMAIEAAIMASDFQEQFAAIGTMIAEAMKDGFQEGELDSISASIDALYAQAVAAVAPINELFQNRITQPSVPAPANGIAFNPAMVPSGASPGAGGSPRVTNINIQSNAPLDPLQTAQAVKAVGESLAFTGGF
jgi:tape measure domain-containing protein